MRGIQKCGDLVAQFTTTHAGSLLADGANRDPWGRHEGTSNRRRQDEIRTFDSPDTTERPAKQRLRAIHHHPDARRARRLCRLCHLRLLRQAERSDTYAAGQEKAAKWCTGRTYEDEPSDNTDQVTCCLANAAASRSYAANNRRLAPVYRERARSEVLPCLPWPVSAIRHRW
jgi:hypothetical protein